MKRLLLLGAGHAHARLLAGLAKAPLYGASLTLVSPYPRQIYSAMLPGVLAGHYRLAQAQFDVAALAARAYADYVEGEVISFDADARTATLAGGAVLQFDLASLNAGSATDQSVPGSRGHALPVKPFDRLVERVRPGAHIAIAGGGAGGAELAMALRQRGGEVTLYSDAAAFAPRLARRVERALRRCKVDYRPGMRVDAVELGPVIVAGASRQKFDLVLWATGAAPLAWLHDSRLALDERGFVRVDDSLRSVSHRNVFAVGDCAALPEAKSGVHAVRHGALLERNLRHLLLDEPLEAHRPAPRALMLLTCGARYAIASRGGWSAEGRWAWWWKNWIDRRWLRRLAGR